MNLTLNKMFPPNQQFRNIRKSEYIKLQINCYTYCQGLYFILLQKMGNQQSIPQLQDTPKSPLILTLRTALRLTPITQNTTRALVHSKFATSLKKQSGQLSRFANPFCPAEIAPGRVSGGEQDWRTCCLISPIMAICSPRMICDENNQYQRESKVSVIGEKGEIMQIKVISVSIVQQFNIALLVLQQPVLTVGWSGITYLKDSSQISNQWFKIINHPRRTVNQQTQNFTYKQQLSKVLYKEQSQFLGSCKAISGSIIFKVIDQKPYVVGIQINDYEGRFFDKQIFDKIHKLAKQEIKSSEKQKEILKSMDLQYLQLLTKW